MRVRQSYWDLASRDLGRVAVGFQSPATDDITIINLGSQMNDAALHYNNAFRIRLDLASPPITTDLRWGQIAHTVDTSRGNFVRYDTPILNGFLFSTAWNDDVWDVAARYQQQSASFRFATGVGYMKDAEREFEDVKGSASLIHDPTRTLRVGRRGPAQRQAVGAEHGRSGLFLLCPARHQQTVADLRQDHAVRGSRGLQGLQRRRVAQRGQRQDA